MQIIDQRILIPCQPQQVWQLISDISRNPEWQVDCKTISFLTTLHSGQGARWRSTSPKGNSHVMEATAWYDGLGYEYRIIDGANFKDNKGLIRLQEIPEGTIVQWTFSYEPGGFLGGMRNLLGNHRQIENMIIESLRLLWRTQTKSSSPQDSYEAKSLMREAPDVQARSQYTPRHPSRLKDSEIESSPLISEPPIAEDDTRPRPAVAATPAEPEPDFLAREPDAPFRRPSEASESPSERAETVNTEEQPDAPEDTLSTLQAQPPATNEIASSPEAQKPSTTTETSDSAETAEKRRETQETAAVAGETTQTEPSAEKQTDEITVIQQPTPESSPPKLDKIEEKSAVDTAEVSVFDLFGLQKPSETQETKAVAPPEDDATQDAETAIAVPQARSTESTPSRTGLRILMRRNRVRLRRP